LHARCRKRRGIARVANVVAAEIQARVKRETVARSVGVFYPQLERALLQHGHNLFAAVEAQLEDPSVVRTLDRLVAAIRRPLVDELGAGSHESQQGRRRRRAGETAMPRSPADANSLADAGAHQQQEHDTAWRRRVDFAGLGRARRRRNDEGPKERAKRTPMLIHYRVRPRCWRGSDFFAWIPHSGYLQRVLH
jgi:hypothetical protein